MTSSVSLRFVRSKACLCLTRGFSLLELVLVLAIAALVVGILSVAVMHARESGRRLQCQNNLHQLGIALANFETHQRRFPGLIEPLPFSKGKTQVGLSSFVALLPELEVSFDFVATGRIMKVGRTDGEFELPPSILVCVSSGERLGYRLNVGTGPASLLPEVQDGFFRTYPQLRVGDIADGLSNTAVFAERMAIDRYGRMPATAAFSGNSFTPSNFLSRCARSAGRGRVFTDRGDQYPWWEPMGLSVMYDHTQAPNGAAMDCHGGSTLAGGILVMNTMAARSFHSGGVYVMSADGAVHWTASGIDLEVWRASATPAGHEKTAAAWNE